MLYEVITAFSKPLSSFRVRARTASASIIRTFLAISRMFMISSPERASVDLTPEPARRYSIPVGLVLDVVQCPFFNRELSLFPCKPVLQLLAVLGATEVLLLFSPDRLFCCLHIILRLFYLVITSYSIHYTKLYDKLVGMLGRFPLPVEVLPMAQAFVARKFVKMRANPVWRENFVTRNNFV